ncbi:MogA/MoaB family molybdenum cofactor biosynthesis protein [Protofrankia symbiont of Coriaria ruscifolia]|uniref:MogA/MoaB family molybdenum cofactor biosynthesis protein n=1 Tax=Protofrankia symbiont of Coriaria ruscifolia TaxID=1306542 RepID=UPI001041028D|nr:MogA/MoaB family molybdenum cofactor biosynthesis protein [Protofrankia symbiont of Coriaria ruscifolia]
MPDGSPGVPVGARARVITVSDRVYAGGYTDSSGPLAAGALGRIGFVVDDVAVVPDESDAIVTALEAAVSAGVHLVVTTGGTGLAPRDVTPEATRLVIDREVPGLAEALRAAGRAKVPTAVLSRGIAGVRGGTLVVNLPGSTGGVADGVTVLAGVVGHAVAQIRGGGDHGRTDFRDDDHDHVGPPGQVIADRAHGGGAHSGGAGGAHGTDGAEDAGRGPRKMG